MHLSEPYSIAADFALPRLVLAANTNMSDSASAVTSEIWEHEHGTVSAKVREMLAAARPKPAIATLPPLPETSAGETAAKIK